MKNSRIKKLFSRTKLLPLLMALLLTLLGGALSASAKEVKPTSISASKKTVTVAAGKEFELKVKVAPLKAEDDYIKWKIVSGSQYICFTDYERDGDDMDFYAIKAGTAVVRCQIKNTQKKVEFTVKVKAADSSAKKIRAARSLTKTVEVGDEFELEVKKYAGLKDKYLKWTIKKSSVVGFEDEDDRTGDDMDFIAKKPGTTEIVCKNTKTGQKVTFTVKVIE